MSTPDSLPTTFRSPSDRVRHALLFECVALALVIPVGAHLFGLHTEDMGIIGIGSAVTATVWNYLYNLGFDHALRRLTGSVSKTVGMRVLHTLLFEAGLQVVLLPAIAWYLRVSIPQAFSMSFSLALFYLVYAFFFNIAYDWVFPVTPSYRAHAVASE
ncbi:PACE efflux transporter [Acetobacter tropicalis]|uniref:PACE efflux transporter n=1 Tax=Acetobacter TaxID=434 RepID=UPI001EDB99D3|nr:PACE efflux transporter [Acetobacter senegalensis]MCG4252316.1 PACE efflux transporter [Acetobacter senegalensis]